MPGLWKHACCEVFYCLNYVIYNIIAIKGSDVAEEIVVKVALRTILGGDVTNETYKTCHLITGE